MIIGAHATARAIGLALQQSNHAVLMVDTNRRDITEARLAGLPTYNGSIIAPGAEEKIDISGLGRMLAMTANHEVNALACMRFARIFGRSEVYQLGPTISNNSSKQVRQHTELSEELRGRQVFNATCSLGDLESRFSRGAQIKKTPLTDLFPLASFRAANPDAIAMFLLGPEGNLSLITEELPNDPYQGHTVISLTAAPGPPSDPPPMTPV